MSKGLIEKLREKADSLTTTIGVMNLLHEAADAMEAKAAPVGEREAFEVEWQRIVIDEANTPEKHKAFVCFSLGAAHQRAQQPQATDWKASGADWCSSIHRNPDAKAWADFFVATFPGLADKHDLMLGWFANAMMAMHDYLKAQQPQSAEAVGFAVFDGPWIEDHTADKNRAEQWAEEGREVVALYTTQQPSAGVVMPKRKERPYGFMHMPSHYEGWNACLDEFARLNGKEVE